MTTEHIHKPTKEACIAEYRERVHRMTKDSSNNESISPQSLGGLPPLHKLADETRKVLPPTIHAGRRPMRPVAARFTPVTAQFDYSFIDGNHTVEVDITQGTIAYCGVSKENSQTMRMPENKPRPLGRALVPVLEEVISAVTFAKFPSINKRN